LQVFSPGGDWNATTTSSGTFTLTPLTVTGVLGDYNGNGVVDAADYVVWRDNPASLQNEGASPGVVNQADYDFWRSRFGATAGSGTLATVPEPGANRIRRATERETIHALRKEYPGDANESIGATAACSSSADFDPPLRQCSSRDRPRVFARFMPQELFRKMHCWTSPQ
jgi:hypothetical protein